MGLSSDATGEKLNFEGPSPGTNYPFITFPAGCAIYTGFQNPNTFVTAKLGSIYLDIGGAIWIKATGDLTNTGWVKLIPTNTVNPSPLLATYASNAAALAGGQVAGDLFKDAAGFVRVVF